MKYCVHCNRLIAGQTIALNKKVLGRGVQKFMCFDCLVEYLGTTREILFQRIHDFIEIEKCELFKIEKPENTKTALKKAQALPLTEKIRILCERVTEWYYHYNGKVYVSFSGGKDSTVLLHIVRLLFPDVEAVFVNTGLEYPEIQKFVKTFDNVTILRPKMRFDEVLKNYGFPIISKEVAETVEQGRKSLERNDGKYTYRLKKLRGEAVDKYGNPSQYNTPKYEPLLYTDFRTSANCCGVMKKAPVKQYEKQTGKKPIMATMAAEGRARETAWIRTGCNAFDSKRPISKPMSFWTEQDVLQYIKLNDIPIASVYGDIVYEDSPEQMRIEEYDIDGAGTEKLTTTGCSRTGCIFCGFGCHLEKEPSRFQRLKETHPRQYEYCINGGEYVEGVWKPNKQGLGMGHIFDELNNIYGDGFIKY